MRPASFIENAEFLARRFVTTVRRHQSDRNKRAVEEEYSAGWIQYGAWLDRADSVESWLRIPGVEDQPDAYNVDGRLTIGAFDSGAFYRQTIIDAMRRYFPAARSFTEFGAGVGRNLIAVKQAIPEAACFGYELCQPGVDVARHAASKFGFDIQYAQLDYVNDTAEKYVFPETDVAFTVFSLEQLPKQSGTALRNILPRVRLGTLHLEPVPENYPWVPRGVLGRIEHRKVDYLGGFDAIARGTSGISVSFERMTSAHNPLMFPSLYILRKT
jgi:hypothetical protein